MLSHKTPYALCLTLALGNCYANEYSIPIAPVLKLDDKVMTNQQLEETAQAFLSSDHIPTYRELEQDDINIWYFEYTTKNNSFKDTEDSLKAVSKKAIKYYWDLLVQKEPDYEAYTVLVTGSFSATRKELDYGVEFKFDEIVFEIEHRW